MSLLIVGTGALACLFAARLAWSKETVTMLGNWPEGLAALREHGVRLIDLDGSQNEFPVRVMETVPAQRKFNQALVLVKSWQTQDVARKVRHCLSEEGVALTLQNGYGNYEVLKKELGSERAALGVTTVGARMLEPGFVQNTGAGKVSLGAHPRLSTLAELLHRAGFVVEVVADPLSLLWGKLVINAAINPLTALLRVANGKLLERAGARQLMAQAAEEATSVARAQGIRLPYPDAVAAAEEVAKNTASNLSSMLQDVLRGTSTEVEAINGAVVRAGEQLGLPIPVNRMLYQLVSSLGHT